MDRDPQQRDTHVSRLASKAKVAGIGAVGVAISLVVAPEALALMNPNHNETVLALD